MDKISKKELEISAVKTILSAIPVPGIGQLFSEAFFEYRSRVKQERLNKFTHLLINFFSENSEEKLNALLENNEDFGDLLESVLKRVVLTKSERKLERFKNVLVNNIRPQVAIIDNADLYLDLMADLSEIELSVLQTHSVFDKTYGRNLDRRKELRIKLTEAQEILKREIGAKKQGMANTYDTTLESSNSWNEEYQELDFDINGLEKYRDQNFYGLTEEDFLFIKQKLYSRGLLIDIGIGRIGIEAFQMMGITQFGKKFIDFIVKD